MTTEREIERRKGVGNGKEGERGKGLKSSEFL